MRPSSVTLNDSALVAIACAFATLHGRNSRPTINSSSGINVRDTSDQDANSPSARGHNMRWIHASNIGARPSINAPAVGSVHAQ